MFDRTIKLLLKNSMIYLLVAILVASNFTISIAPTQVIASTVLKEGAFDLTATNQNEKNFISLEWFPNMPNDLPDSAYNYTIYQSSDLGTTWEKRSANYGKKIRVLNVYPYNSAKNIKGDQLKKWMEESVKDSNGVTYPPAGYINGEQLIYVDPVTFQDFNLDPSSKLKDAAGKYKYDVVMFGSGDSNFTNGDLTPQAYTEIKNYLDIGYGVLAGHDVFARPNATDNLAVIKYDTPNLNALSVDYFGISPIKKPSTSLYVVANGTGSTGTVKVINNGFLLNYPWNIPFNQQLTVPLTHTTMQYTKGTVWMNFDNPQKFGTSQFKVDTFTDGATNNFYLATYNNTAIIQTGHVILNTSIPAYPSTNDERQAIANTLMYLAQVTTDTRAEDHSARDIAPPKIPNATQSLVNEARNISITSVDEGTPYQYYIEAKDMNYPERQTYISDQVEESVTTRLKGYFISEDDDPSGSPTITRDISGNITTPLTLSATDGQAVNYTPKTDNPFIHIVAVDHAGNLSVVKTLGAHDLFTISLNAATDKKYKPNFPVTSANVRTVGTIIPDEGVHYIMLPTTDTRIITTKAEFEAIAATVPDAFKGTMHKTDANLYNMSDINNPNLNGVLENCTLWVMATGTYTNDQSEVVAFDSHVFKNIYTPINVYQMGEMTSGSALYAKTRVGIEGDLEAVYGIPLDLDGQVIAEAPLGYDEIAVLHENLEPLWTFDSSVQNDVLSFILNDTSQINKVFKFQYEKNTENWFSATFKFEDHATSPNALSSEIIVDDFVPNDNGEKAYMFAKDLYVPPIIPGYDPIGYKIDDGEIIYTSFPLKYGSIVLTDDHQTVTIVYDTTEKRLSEEYHLYEMNENGIEVFTGEIEGILPSITSVSTGSSSTLHPLTLYGYVYKGYSLDNGLTFIDGIPTAPVTVNADTRIIYKYKPDTTLTGVADEDIKRIVVSGTGIDAHGRVIGALYTDNFDVAYGTAFQPIPRGTADGTGKMILPGDTPSQWILSTEPGLYAVDPFTVTGNRAIKFYYFKDTSGNGIPDYLEANVTIKYFDEANRQFLLPELLITEYSPNESFSREAPIIKDYLAVGYIVNMDGAAEGTPVYPVGVVNGETGILGTNNWTLTFLYQPDRNHNGIPDNDEAKIIVETVYQLANGQEETAQTEYIGQHGESLSLSATTLNKDSNRFEYVSGLSSENATYRYDYKNPQTIIVVFKEKVDTTPKSSKSHTNSGGSGVIIPTPSTKPITEPKVSELAKDNKGSGRNDYRWSTFEKPEEIFLDGQLIPLSGLVFNGPYINGYPDRTVRPNHNLTRAEAAQILYNLYGQPDEFADVAKHLPYKDVSKDAWYAKAVAFLNQYKMISGYPDGSFYPNKPITRAELVTLLVKYENIDANTATETIFNDLENHWAKAQIYAAFEDKIISGYPDATFKPDTPTTRSEAVTIVNALLERPDKWIGQNDYVDLSEKDWAYKKLMNASNGYAED